MPRTKFSIFYYINKMQLLFYCIERDEVCHCLPPYLNMHIHRMHVAVWGSGRERRNSRFHVWMENELTVCSTFFWGASSGFLKGRKGGERREGFWAWRALHQWALSLREWNTKSTLLQEEEREREKKCGKDSMTSQIPFITVHVHTCHNRKIQVV